MAKLEPQTGHIPQDRNLSCGILFSYRVWRGAKQIAETIDKCINK